MEQLPTLGRQVPGTVPVLLSEHGGPPPGVLRKQTDPAFPRPGRRARIGLALLIAVLTGIAAVLIWSTGTPTAAWAALIVPIALGVPGIFLLRALLIARDRAGTFHGTGVVILTDHAGIVNGDDAQQRALIHVERAGQVLWLGATQAGLRVAEGDRVRVSWASPLATSCYVHETLPGRPDQDNNS